MAEDLDAILATAFAPIPPEVRHVELVVSCARCTALVETIYPSLGLPSEVRIWKNCRLGKRCPGCRQKFEMTSHLGHAVTAVEPGERGFQYCIFCKQIFPLATMAKTPTGWQCMGCAAVEEAKAMTRATPDEGW